MKGRIEVLTLAALFALLLLAALSMHPLGRPPVTAMDDYFILNGQAQTGCNNIVTSVVFDYRGMDTLVEASVLFAAVAGIIITLGGGDEKGH
jgi:multisubunit Na+/H+ antiporter MnhB subunit